MVVERHGEVVRVPAEAGVVEVDDVQPFAVDDDVRRMQVGVNQAEDAPVLPVSGEDRVDPVPQGVQPSTLTAVEVRRLPEAAPERLLAHEAVGVEGVSREALRDRPAFSLLVQGRDDGAEPDERALDVGLAPRTDPVGQRLAVHPLEEPGIASFVSDGDRHVAAAVRCLHHDGDVDPGIEQRGGPGLFGDQFRVIVVPGPVQTQHVRPPVRIRDPKRDVLGDRYEGDVGDGERPGLERLPGRTQVLSGIQGRQGFARMRPGMPRHRRRRTPAAVGS